MHKPSWFVALLTLASVLCGCASHRGVADPGPNGLDLLASRMTGTYSSARQAAADPAYFEISLVMTPIWQDRPGADERWLYVEQAMASALAKPYRQRIYRLTQVGPRTFKSDVYTLPGNPLDYAGAWRDPSRFAALKPSDLTLRDGCSILLDYDGDAFRGGTEGTKCPSDLRGAAYATSQATIKPDRMISWDRGFDAQGKQVWGAEAGGYVFMRVEPAPTSKAG